MAAMSGAFATSSGVRPLGEGTRIGPSAARVRSAARHCASRRKTATVRFAEADPPMYPEPKGYQSDGPLDDQGEEPMELSDPSLDLERAARAFWRVPWASWWVQLALTLVGGIILVFALSFPNLGPKTAAGATGLVTASVAAIFSVVSLFWTYGYTRLGLKLEKNLDAVEAGESFAKARNVKPVSSARIYYTLRIGVLCALGGLFVSLVGLQSVTGVLLAKVLTQGFAGTYNQAGGGVPIGGVQPLDIFVVQAIANIMLSLFTSLTTSLWLSTTYRKRD